MQGGDDSRDENEMPDVLKEEEEPVKDGPEVADDSKHVPKRSRRVETLETALDQACREDLRKAEPPCPKQQRM